MFTLQVFNANDGRNDIVKHSLVGLIRARFIRFQPTDFIGRKALRVEVYGILTTAGILCKDSRLLPFPVVYAHYIFSPLPTIHMNHLYEIWKGENGRCPQFAQKEVSCKRSGIEWNTRPDCSGFLDVLGANIWFRVVVNAFQTGKSSAQFSAVP